MTFTLEINTATPQAEIAVLKGKNTLASIKWKSCYNETEVLLRHISKILRKQRLTWKNIDRILVCEGPGSFSALRIGVTTANTLSFLLKIPLYTFNAKTLLIRRKRMAVPIYSLPPNITKSKK